jgi:hypothetical protein
VDYSETADNVLRAQQLGQLKLCSRLLLTKDISDPLEVFRVVPGTLRTEVNNPGAGMDGNIIGRCLDQWLSQK